MIVYYSYYDCNVWRWAGGNPNSGYYYYRKKKLLLQCITYRQFKKTYYSFIAVVITVIKKEFTGVSHTQSSTGADGIKANWVNSSHGTISSNSVNSVASSCTQHKCTHNTRACSQHMHIYTSWLLKLSVKLWGSKNLIWLQEVLMLFMKQAFLLLLFFFFLFHTRLPRPKYNASTINYLFFFCTLT